MRLIAIPLLAVLPACSSTGARPPASAAPTPIVTDDSVYTVTTGERTYEVEIGFTFTNSTARTIELPGCRGIYPPVLERWTDGEWIVAYAPPRLLCYEPPTEVAPGESISETLRISAGRPGTDVSPQLEVPRIEGTYRLNWGVPAAQEGEMPDAATVPGGALLSNTFRLVG